MLVIYACCECTFNACCYTYLYIGSAKVQQKSNFTKRKSNFFDLYG